MLSRVHYETPLFDKGLAGKYIGRARELDPNSVDYMVAELQQLRLPSWNNLAELLQHEERRALAELILEVDSTNAFAHEELGASYIRDYWEYRNAIALPDLQFARQDVDPDAGDRNFNAADPSQDEGGGVRLYGDTDLGRGPGAIRRPQSDGGLRPRRPLRHRCADVPRGCRARPQRACGPRLRAGRRPSRQGAHLRSAPPGSLRPPDAYPRARGLVRRGDRVPGQDVRLLPRRRPDVDLPRPGELPARTDRGRSDQLRESLGADEPGGAERLRRPHAPLVRGRPAAVPGRARGVRGALLDESGPPATSRRTTSGSWSTTPRLVYADLLYAAPELDLRGWETRRGEIIVRYGPPTTELTITGNFGEVISNFGFAADRASNEGPPAVRRALRHGRSLEPLQRVGTTGTSGSSSKTPSATGSTGSTPPRPTSSPMPVPGS